MQENITDRDIKNAGLEGKWVRVITPATNIYTGKTTFSNYGTLIRLTDEYLILFSKRNGLTKIPLENILNIACSKKPEMEV